MISKFKVFAAAAIIAPVMYVCFVLLGGLLTPNYSSFTQTISTLIQSGAPYKAFLDTGFTLSNFCLTLFGYGLFELGRKRNNRSKAVTGLLLMLGGIGGVLMLLFSKDADSSVLTVTGFMHHFIVGGLTVTALVSILFAELAEIHDGKFRKYSNISLLLMFAFAVITVAAGFSKVSLVGLFERITIILYLQWLMVMAVVVLKHSAAGKKPKKIKSITEGILYIIRGD